MKGVELYARVRFAVQIEGVSRREAARRFGLDPRTVAKMLAFSVPPGYRRSRPPARPKLDPFTGIIDAILAADEGRPRKQRHTSKRIFERLRDEHGYSGGITIVKDYVLARRLRHREVFVPLRHDPGHAQVDFGEALAEIAGVEGKIHFFAMDLPHSDACFVQAYPAETAEAFCDGHNDAFAFFGKVPRSILYDNTALAVARILGDGVRQRTRVFSELQSHYVFADRFGRPGKGNDKGKVEGLVGWVRRNLLVPVPRAASLAALNEQLLEGCRRRRGDRLVRRTVNSYRNYADIRTLEARVRDLAAAQRIDREIATTLTAEGLLSAHGRPFSGGEVHILRKRWQIPTVKINGTAPNPPRWPDGTYQGAAAALSVSTQTVFKWLQKGGSIRNFVRGRAV